MGQPCTPGEHWWHAALSLALTTGQADALRVRIAQDRSAAPRPRTGALLTRSGQLLGRLHDRLHVELLVLVKVARFCLTRMAAWQA